MLTVLTLCAIDRSRFVSLPPPSPSREQANFADDAADDAAVIAALRDALLSLAERVKTAAVNNEVARVGPRAAAEALLAAAAGGSVDTGVDGR